MIRAMRNALLLVVLAAAAASIAAQRPSISNRPDTPFKLATFEAGGRVRVGLVLANTIVDIAGANTALTRNERLPALAMPSDMRTLIEEYARVSPRLYQIANRFKEAKP